MSGGARIAVVGGGISGLAAALRCLRSGAVPVVLEASDRIGGRCVTVDVDGMRVDASVQLLASAYRTLFGLLREADGGGLVVRAPGRDALWRGGRAHEVVYGSPASMAASSAIPFGLKLKLGAKYLPLLARHDRDLDSDRPWRAAQAGLDRESVARWGARELGRDFVELLVGPTLGAFYGASPEETGAGVYHLLAAAGASAQVYAARGGAERVPEVMAEAVRRGGGAVRTGAAVHSLDWSDGGVDVDWGGDVEGDGNGVGGTERFDGVVLAVPAPVQRTLLAGRLPRADRWLAEVRYRASVTLALPLDRPAGVRWFGLSFPRSEARSVVAVCAEENKGPAELVPPGRGLLVVFPTAEAGPRLLDADDSTVVDTLLPDVRRALPNVDRLATSARVFRWPAGWPLLPPGALAGLGAANDGSLEDGTPVALAGDHLGLPTCEGAAVAGLRAAERVLRRIGAG